MPREAPFIGSKMGNAVWRIRTGPLPNPALFYTETVNQEDIKLAATTMNPHYHPYTELSPHSPPPDGGAYSNGHHVMGAGPPPHEHHHHHHPFPPPPHLHHHHHHINSNNNNNNNSQTNNNNNNNNQTNNNNNTTGSGGGGGGGGISGGVKVCAGCGSKILERFLLHALDRYWHNSCLKCSCCGAMLADIGSSCFTKSNMILCKNDYIRLFGSTGACSACGQTIPASEFVMRASSGAGGPQHHVFHLKCFACSKCGAQLVPGDRYYLLGGSLVCEQDWHKLVKASGGTGAGQSGAAPSPAPGVRKGKVGRPRRSRD
ncbi:uncharacterized protein isoform X2 [Rhodnius prolixus]|uniref:uncharacterized protein isoform X2 n=1 Tax=Rhodnius prolixus TaxID=13249 RepID=UPI003D18946E